MKTLLTILLIATIFISCTKNNNVNPGSNVTKTTTLDTVSQINADIALHTPIFKVNPQQVITSISDKTLILKFNENVDLSYTAAGYQKISSVHLLESFNSALLSGFEYTTVAQGGNTTLNWVDDNLNNVILKSVTDTVINNVNMVKINVHRQFTFFKTYDSNQIALNEQTIFINKRDDIITFSSYCYYNQKNYPIFSISAKVLYTK
ncbi:MAG: hypothetical protein JWP44_1539 [Mucilaginibacter sp.]|nr:hypothetical protein [Mucilaginibacter sp.]